MAHSNGKITAPINVETDVYAVLGIGPTSKGYDIGYACANTHGKINMWARYKPVILPVLETSTLSDWWKSRDHNCGIVTKKITSYKDIVNNCNGTNNGWYYNPPIGGSNSPYRITDFDGYNHNAIVPVGNFNVPSTAAVTYGSTFGCSVAIFTQEGGVGDNIDMKDITDITDCYLGVYCVPSTGSQWRRVTSTRKLFEGGSIVTVNAYGMSTGTWTIYPFLSTAMLGQDSPDLVSDYYTIPMTSPKQIKLISSYITISIMAGELPSVAGAVDVTVNINNQSANAITFKNNYWQTRFVSKKFDDPFMNGEQQGKIDDFTIAANTRVNKIVTVRVSQVLIDANGAKVWISLNSGNYLGSTIFMTQIGPNM